LVKNDEGILIDSERENADGKITRIYENGINKQYCYDNNGRLIKNLRDGIIVNEYEYDKLGRVYKEYDYENDRLYEYLYDNYGNLEEKNSYLLTENEIDNLIDKDEYLYNKEWGNLLQTYNGQEITYDKMGNPLKYLNDVQFTWNGRELVGADVDGIKIEYSYDENGYRVSKNIAGKITEYVYEGSDIIAEITEEHVLVYVYDAYADLIGFIYDDNKYYYGKNAMGDVTDIYDNYGNIICSYKYDAWGNVVTITGDLELAEINHIRYRGYYYDNETRLYYLISRYYDSEVGRFVNSDDIKMMLYSETCYNLYSYCNNDPINKKDSQGDDATDIRDVVVIHTDAYDSDREIKNLCKVLFDTMDKVYRLYLDLGGDYISKINHFIDFWNTEAAYYDYIIINTHGTEQRIFVHNMTSWLTAEQIAYHPNMTKDQVLYSSGSRYDEMEVIPLKYLILLSCNVGHYRNKTDNVAAAFSRKMTGLVLASDGTVNVDFSTDFWRNYYKVSSLADEEWVRIEGENPLGKRNTNEGWLIYYWSRLIGKASIGKKDVSITSLVNCLQNSNYISFK